jgi:hypothetical protein
VDAAARDASPPDAALPDAPPPDAPPPDAPPACVPRAAVCDPVCNSGCSGGNRCDISASANTGQCIAAGSGVMGSVCTGSANTDSCQAQNTCLNDTPAASHCHRLCYGDSDCGAGLCCNITITLASQQPSGFNACIGSSACNPTATSAGPCGAGNACYLLPCATNTSLTDCACASQTTCGYPGAGTLTNGQSCTYVNDCAPGFTCVGGMNSVCRRTCTLAAPACPAGNPTCTPLQIDTGIQSTVYGVCL